MNKKALPPPEDWPKTHTWPLKKGVEIVAINEMFPPIYILNTGEWVYGVLPQKSKKKKSSKVVKKSKNNKSKVVKSKKMYKRKKKHTWNN